MSQNDIKQIELSIEEAERLRDLGRKAERLASNRDFKAVILDGYLRDEAVRLGHLSSDPMMKEHREEILRDLHGVGALQRFLQNMIRVGQLMEDEIEQHRMTLDEMRSEADE